MKNTHVLPTDKPSRLVLDTVNKNLFLTTTKDFGTKIMQFQNIYITSSEEIKEGDWFTDNNNSLKRSYKLSHVQFANPKKIILTTDQDLINDNVQAIDDEFLQWFVKNPSCEEVEVFYQLHKDEPLYKKQETLEQAAEKFIKLLNFTSLEIDDKLFEAILFGANWQAERIASEK